MDLTIILTHEGNASRALNQVLGKRVHTDKTASGVPYIRGDEHCLSLSHKDNRLALALSQRPVGIDIEKIVDKEAYYRIAATYFAEKIPEGDIEAFFRAWTRREAYGKLLGTGLNGEVMRMDLSADKIEVSGEAVYFVEKRIDEYMITVASYYPEGDLVQIGGEQDEE